MDESWQRDAACVGCDPDLWFSHDPADQAAALRTCAACPVRDACLDHALVHNPAHDDHGIWGGTDPRQRRAIRAEAATHNAGPPGVRRRCVQAVGDLEQPARRVPPPALLDVLAHPDGTYTDATGRVVVVLVDPAPRWVVLVDDRVVARSGSLMAARAAGWTALHSPVQVSETAA